ncbi:hypothetical protein CKN86_01275 [Carnobacterium divergens]|uniref:hypothetical protein n=2 Tax=Carnobacterium divergens TaxID=2748 RepID=UPI000D4E7CF0|nr:hypothetical protein [Carnobacterium divergens]MCO6018463.1 hypothetical protein [Carnobacterium divergens]MPQ22150.1 hypothetical protein [Carnobacterium divergens]TFI65213.1 hypothetical protein CKN62_01275 [Carnobacterium divergens]TFI92103.1 hypothetical protein CKN84_01275 [Carnobacterium divergens]TFJ07326.1 hypothetical protein CKN86_01275 [Carnobacterium divergens]
MVIIMSHTDFCIRALTEECYLFLKKYIEVTKEKRSKKRNTVDVSVRYISEERHVILFTFLGNSITKELNYKIDSYMYKKNMLRMIRYMNEFFMRRDGYLFFHAAAIISENLPIIISGNKFSGKTTLTLALLDSDSLINKLYVSNDKLAIKKNGNIYDAYSSPISMGIRRPTYDMFNKNGRFNSLNLEKDGDKIGHLTTQQIEDAFGCGSSNYIDKFRTIFKPAYSEDNKFCVNKLDEEDKYLFFKEQHLDRLTDCPFGDDDHHYFGKNVIKNNEIDRYVSSEIQVTEISYGKNDIQKLIEYIKSELNYG